MAIPFFYIETHDPSIPAITLNEETSKHVVQVLRMKAGEQIMLTDGTGTLFTTEITGDHKKKCTVRVLSAQQATPVPVKISIAISLVKNNSRFEWFLEKATEIGIGEIIPLICDRTEKQTFRKERMQAVLISAMLQSRQCWLPLLRDPVSFQQTVLQARHQQKLIAHCLEDQKKTPSEIVSTRLDSRIMLIGPEGDFSRNEIELAIQHDFIPVTLGNTRLRTETAGIVAATLLKIAR